MTRAGTRSRPAAGWGLYEDDGIRELAVWVGLPCNQESASIGNGTMVAFRARTGAEVVRDPNGNKLAAVCRVS